MTHIQKSHKRTVAAGRFKKEKAYWLRKLSGELVVSRFPYDDPGEPAKNRRESFGFPLGGEIYSRLMKLRNESDLRLHMTVIAALTVLLHRYTSANDIILGTPILKQEREAEFINTVLPLRNSLAPGMTFKELLLQVRQTVMEAMENQNYPVEILPDQLNISSPGKGGFPLFDTAVLLENIHDKRYIEHVHPGIIFSFSRNEDRIEGVVDYDARLYRKDTIERMTAHLTHLLKDLLFNIHRELAAVDILSEQEKHRLLEEFNDTTVDYPGDKTVHRLFEERAQREPGNIALADPDGIRSISYEELNRKSRALAGLLKAGGAGPDCIVPVIVERSIEMVAAMLGILKAGAGYLPIDTNYPEERVQYMLKDSGAGISVAGKKSAAALGLEEVIDPCGQRIYRLEKEYPGEVEFPGDLLYVIYTSGSTGKPKGVLVDHRGFVNMIYFHRSVFGEGHRTRMSQVASAGFDAMAFEIWPCMACGGTLYFADDETRIDSLKMKEWLIANRIDVSYQPTVLAEQLLNEEWPREGVALRALRAAGEQLNRYPGDRHRYPFRFYNLYGPTENTVWTTWAEIKTGGTTLPGIGKPIGNHRVYILSPDLQLRPIGVPGELCIGGVGLARGYLNRPGLTAERFVFYRSYMSYKSYRAYRTGDLARWLPDGNIEFLGRIDYQVKIRGFRRLEVIPGVASVSYIGDPPMGFNNWAPNVWKEEDAGGQRSGLGRAHPVGIDYFRTMGIPITRGRTFTVADDANSPRVIVMSETMARELWPGEDPVGKRLGLSLDHGGSWYTVVGVSGDIRQRTLASEPNWDFYLPFAQAAYSLGLFMAVRTTGDPMPLAGAFREAVWAIDANVLVPEITTMEARRSATLTLPRFRVLLLTAFAAVALSLASAGVYGTLMYTVGKRTPEMGIRMALGAQSGDAVRLVLREGLRPVILGLGAGLAGSLASARLLESVLFQVSPSDPLTLTMVAATLVGVSLVACYVPARRASRIEPLTALRAE